MKLATLKDGSRDGKLVVVSRDMTRCTDASFLARTLQAALDDWRRVAPHLAALAQSLEVGAVPSERFHEHDAASPLPRAYQHIGSADTFVGPRDPIVMGSNSNTQIEASLAVLSGDVSGDADAAATEADILLILLVATAGGVHREAAGAVAAFSPVAVTPDEIDGGLAGLSALSIHLAANGKLVPGGAAGGSAKPLGSVLADAARGRKLSAGAIIVGGQQIASPALGVGDTLRIEMKDRAGHSIFGAIEQTVAAASGS